MRSIWSGMISFGLVNIPVRLYAAVTEKSLDLDYLHKKDLSRIRYARICELTGEEVPYRDIVRGYEYRKGEYVVLNDEDFEKADTRGTRSLDLLGFAGEREIDTKLIERPYYVEPAKQGAKMYALFREALKRSGKVGIVEFVLKRRAHMGYLKAEGDVIVLTQMRYAGEIREYGDLELPGNGEIDPGELDLSLKLVDQLTKPFDPGSFTDTYTKALKQIIESKVQGRPERVRRREEAPTRVDELVDKLRESLEYAGRR